MYTKPGVYKILGGRDCLRTEPDENKENSLGIYIEFGDLILVFEKLHKFWEDNPGYSEIFWFKGMKNGIFGYFVIEQNELKEVV